jgi:hypothetical protein
LNKWLREPLLHFLLIGAALFLLYGLQNEGYVNDDNRIVISQGNIDRLISLWEKKRQRLPTQAELQGMIEQQVREEVMYREALAMGMDKNDAIVRRRLAQKVEFISSDIAAMAEPSDEDLIKYLKENHKKFETLAAISFEHIYFNNNKREAQTEPDALKLLDELKQSDELIDTQVVGDPFMMGQQYDELTEYGVSRIFGQKFAAELFMLSVDGWQGPVTSGYGMHLVRISNKRSAQAAELNTVRENVRNEWQAEQRQSMNKTFYESLRQRYDIVIENTSKNMPDKDKSREDELVSTKP